MSLSDWKERFYPTDAAKVDAQDYNGALAHSIKKWSGLKDKILTSYSLVRRYRCIIDNDTLESLRIDDSTCALCEIAYALRERDKNKVLHLCFYCPHSHKSCSDAYEAWFSGGENIPMLRWLAAGDKQGGTR